MFRFALLSLLANLIASPAFAGIPDATFSRISTDKTHLKADGIENARISVTVKDTNALPITNAFISLQSDRGALDEVIADQPTTNELGQAKFIVRSLKNGSARFTALVDNISLQKSVDIVFENGLNFPIAVGDLIKIPDDGDARTLNDTAVYYYATNGKRYVFPNEKTFFTWYPDFSRVHIIPPDQMALIPIGGNITYKPGSKLVKFQTDPKTYVVTRGGVLRWAKTEDIARNLYGANWGRQIDDISEAFYVNYTFGAPLDSALDAPLDIIRSGAQSIDQDLGLINNQLP